MKNPVNNNGVQSNDDFVSDVAKLPIYSPEVTQNNINNRINPDFDLNSEGINMNDIKLECEKLASCYTETNDNTSTPFPFEVFPLAIQEIIKSTNDALNFPIDFIGASMLYSVSVAVGLTHRAEVKNGWLESPVLYIAIVGPAGTNKTHPLFFALQPLIGHDKTTFSQYEIQRQEYEKAINLSKKERELQSIEEPIKPVRQKFLLSDFTQEALAEVHKFNKRGIGVYVDELAGWFKNFNRYNNGSEMEFWLSAWSGNPINIDRKTGDPVFIPLPFISVCGTIQNGILNELAKGNRTQNGFIERILFVIPDNLRKEYWSETELSPIVTKNWKMIIDELLKLPITNDETMNPNPEILKCTFEAKEILFEWQKVNTDQINLAENEEFRGIYSKMEMYAVRLALILEMMKYACHEGTKQVISAESMQGALKLVEYFKNSGRKVKSIISNINPLDKHAVDKQALYQALPDKFTTESGLHIAVSLGIRQRTFQYFLNEKDLFIRIRKGEYQKII